MLKQFKTLRYALAGVLLLFCAAVQAQTISGNVKDSNGEAIIGATIMEQGTQNGTVTDFDGNFTIKLQKAGNLNVSYVGMQSQVVKTAGKSSVKVVLADDNTTLNDVVVVGYGTMKRKDLTGSVSSVTGDKLTEVPVANVSEALQGKLGGVTVTAQDGRPGADMSIRVRGGGSITQSNEPLYIVDGIAVSTISDIPADNIESIDVLKDASSTAIYGARGANGVILVTTKGAKEGKPVVKYNMYYQIKAKPKTNELQDAYTYVLNDWALATAFGNGDGRANYYGLGSANGNHLNDYKNVASHNYMDDVFQSGHMWSHDLSLSGGNEKTKYYASVSYVNDGATMMKSGYSRWNINMKLQQKIAKNLTLDADARYMESSQQSNRFFSGSHASNVLVYPWMYNMIDEPLGSGATTDFGEGGDYYASKNFNPVSVINDNDYTQKKQNIRLNTALTWKILKSLTAKTELSLSRNWSKTETWVGPNTGRDLTSSAKLAEGDGYSTAWTTTLNYDFSDIIKSEDHVLGLLLGNEVLGSRSNTATMYGYQYPSTWGEEQAFGQMHMYQDGNQSYFKNNIGVPSHTLSWFGRLNYNLLGRYMFTFTMRADGSSKFADGNRWGYFPAGAIAWRISDEPFLANTKDWLDNLKLRLSIGTSGNDGIDASAFIDEWTSTQDPTTGLWSYSQGTLKGNPNLTWEKTTSRNAGLDYSFLNGKFNGSIDFYWNTTSDCLMRVPINSATGYSYQYQNAAKTENKGIEFAFNYNIINKKDFTLNFGVTYNYNYNEVKEVPEADMSAGMTFASTAYNPQKPYVIEAGQPVGIIKGYESDGFYTLNDFNYDASTGVYTLKDGVSDCTVSTYKHSYKLASGQNAFPGMPKYKDVDGSGTIDNNDLTVIGRMNPRHTGGFNFSGRWKSIDFNANFTYQLDGKVFNANYARSIHSGNNKWNGMSRLATTLDNQWKMYNVDANGDLYFVTDYDELAALNANAEYGVLSYVANDAPVISSDYIESAAYLRLQSITIGYTFPKSWVNKIGISNARVYFTGGNLFCITGYNGLDPDVNTDSSTDSSYSGFPTPGYDYQAYPKSRTFTFGLNVAF